MRVKLETLSDLMKTTEMMGRKIIHPQCLIIEYLGVICANEPDKKEKIRVGSVVDYTNPFRIEIHATIFPLIVR